MASIRRNQSPYNHNGGSPFSGQTPSQKLFSSGNGHISSPLSRFFSGGVFLARNSKRISYISWRKSLYRCLMFFLFGLLLGMAPFGHIEEEVDLKNRESFDRVAFEMKQPQNANDVVNLKEEIKDEVFTKRENLFIDTVELSVDFNEKLDFMPLKQLIVVTPTYNRALQAYYLNRLGQMLRLVRPPLLWIVVEMKAASMETAEVLRKMGVMYRHLVCAKNLTDVKDRGVHQRNRALEHIEHHKLDGIVYFADDDNVYTLELFESLRGISRFGTWPVAMLAQSKNKAILEGPVCNGSQVIGWHTNEKSKRLRRFHVDMSGFAFNSTILWDPKRWRRPTSDPIRQLDTVKEGFQETTFIEQIVEDESQMEGIPSGCSRIMNWHLHLDARQLVYPQGWLLQKNLDVVFPVK